MNISSHSIPVNVLHEITNYRFPFFGFLIDWNSQLHQGYLIEKQFSESLYSP